MGISKKIMCDDCSFCDKFVLMDNYEDQWNGEKICIYCKYLQDKCEQEMRLYEQELGI